MDELGVALQVVDREKPRLLVSRRVEGESVPRSHTLVARRPELRARPEEREVDIEEDRLEHGVENTGEPGVPRPPSFGTLLRPGVWRSLVARSVRVGEAPSSNLGTPIAPTRGGTSFPRA